MMGTAGRGNAKNNGKGLAEFVRSSKGAIA